MKRFLNIIRAGLISLAVALPMTLATASSASAYLTNCFYGHWTNGSGYDVGYEQCNGHVNNGGLNQVRVLIYCNEPIIGGSTYVYGPWVNQGYSSYATCPQYFPFIYAHDYQLR